MYDTLTEVWQTRTDNEQYEQTWVAPYETDQAFLDSYCHDAYDSGDSRDFVSDTHPEDTWN